MAGNPALKSRNKLPRSIQMMVDAGRLTEDEAHSALGGQKRTKYGNVHCEMDNHSFDSRAEARHYAGNLKLRERAGEISELAVHPVYPLQVNGQHIANYEADFSFRDVKTGRLHVHDVKGGHATITDVFKIKIRLLNAIYGIEVEVIPCS